MIELYSQRMAPPPGVADRAPVNLETLAADLNRAQMQSGIHESWLTDHLLAALRQLEGDAAQTCGHDAEDNFDRMVVRMLVDAGFPDVAAAFAQIRKIELAIPEPANRTVWNAERVRRVLVEHIGTSETTAARLAGAIVEKLDALGFSRVGDVLIVEIARHLLNDWADRSNAEQIQGGQGWLMPPGYWETFLPAAAAGLIGARALEVRPVSRLMPVVRIEFNVYNFALAEALLPLTELAFLPALRNACQCLREVVDKVREQVAATHGADIAGHPAHVNVKGVRLLFSGNVGRRQLAAAREAEVRELVTRELATAAGTTLVRFETDD